MIKKTGDALIDALGAQCPGYAVDKATSLQDYDFLHPDAALVPVLADASWGDGPTVANAYRPISPTFAIHTFTHGLYGDPGAYELLADVEAAVEGLEVEGSGSHPGGIVRIQQQMFERALPGGTTIYVTQAQLTQSD
jgi:hypothetical protein